MGKVTLLVTLGAGAFCRKSRRGDTKGEEKDTKIHLGQGLQGRDADAGEFFRGTHQAPQSERSLGQRRGSWPETAASVPRTFDSTPAFDASLRQRDSKQPQVLE